MCLACCNCENYSLHTKPHNNIPSTPPLFINLVCIHCENYSLQTRHESEQATVACLSCIWSLSLCQLYQKAISRRRRAACHIGHTVTDAHQGSQIWQPNRFTLATNGTSLGLFKISFGTVWVPKWDKSGTF